MRLKEQAKTLSAGLKIVFDFGESSVYSIWNGLKGKQKLVDENGKEIDFNSMVDAANYMSEKDGTFSRHILHSMRGYVIHHWIFL